MRIIFCDNGFDSKEVDYMYAAEYQAAQNCHLTISLISFEEIKRKKINAALKRVQAADGGRLIPKARASYPA